MADFWCGVSSRWRKSKNICDLNLDLENEVKVKRSRNRSVSLGPINQWTSCCAISRAHFHFHSPDCPPDTYTMMTNHYSSRSNRFVERQKRTSEQERERELLVRRISESKSLGKHFRLLRLSTFKHIVPLAYLRRQFPMHTECYCVILLRVSGRHFNQ